MFGLLAFNALPDGPGANSALDAMVLVVLGSILLHGGGSMAIARALRGKPRARRDEENPAAASGATEGGVTRRPAADAHHE
ncbi:hypothetical protein [Kitasatospora sp. NPDC050463]|uniref:hypothetical protein n=1 Tax=Kitasatospora sp. NPDC050463 TaxID=3155786 RepID=UPI0033F99840